MVASVTPIHAASRARALEFLREASVVNEAPPYFIARLDAVDQAVLTAPTDAKARRLVVRAWQALERLRPRVRVRSPWRPFLRGDDTIGDDPPEAVRIDWPMVWMPEDVNRFRRDVDAAFNSLDRKINRQRNQRGFTATQAQEEARARFLERLGNWRRESARLGGSFWDRAWRDGKNAVDAGATSYAQARADLIAAGWLVRGTVPAESLPGTAPRTPLFDGFFGSGTGLAIAAVAVIFILSKNR